MSGDYSRKRFDPTHHYSGVLQQQGRVALDADWNEYVDLQDRRWRAETIDVVGTCGVPDQTPDGFKIGIVGGALTIGPGRMYVDGFLAENQGADPFEFLSLLEEKYGSAAILLADQPYGANAPVIVPPAGRVMVYLDVWRRKLNHLKAPHLIEPAVNVDTTTRYQTAWRVRLLGDLDNSVDCETPLDEIPNWPTENLPSAARLSTSTIQVDPSADPCLVPPSGGYRGLENHLYRVEVHDADANGVRVKWSRDNATVSGRILEILPGRTELRLDSIGRDDVLRITSDDWVEITSDRRELLGLPGEMRKVVDVNDTAQTLTFNNALPSVDYPVGNTPEEDHFRVIRWDQSRIVRRPDGTDLINLNLTNDGLIPLTSADNKIVLENGIQIDLDVLAGGSANTGDYWCFAARTADASVEILDHEPPQGIHHHFCCLAIVESDGDQFTGIPDDCRPVFPPLTEIQPGCCTEVVRPGEDIQTAIDSLPPEGGCVCLKTGVHEIDQPLRIENSNIVLHGETPDTRVLGRHGPTLLVVGHPRFVQIEKIRISDIRFHAAHRGRLEPIVDIRRTEDLELHNCGFELPPTQVANVVAVRIDSCVGVEVRGCDTMGSIAVGVWVIADSTDLSILDNRFEFSAKRHTALGEGGIVGILLEDAFGPSRIQGNDISGYLTGIVLDSNFLGKGLPSSGAHGSIIAHNRITRFSTDDGNQTNVIADMAYAYAIQVAARDCVITENTLTYRSPSYGGVLVTGSNCRVGENRLVYTPEPNQGIRFHAIGILIGVLSTIDDGSVSFPIEGGCITHNHVAGPHQFSIAAIDTSSPQIVHNKIEGDRSGRVNTAIVLFGVDHAIVQDNTIDNAQLGAGAINGRSNTVTTNHILNGGIAAAFNRETALAFSQNRIKAMEFAGFAGMLLLDKCLIAENRLENCGYQLPSSASSILVIAHFGELDIQSNHIADTGVSPGGKAINGVTIGIFAAFIMDCRVQSNTVTFLKVQSDDLGQEHRALWLLGLFETASLGFSAQVLDNKFIGPGRSALIEVQQLAANHVLYRFERVFFNNNFCWHLNPAPSDSLATLLVHARSAIVQGNHFKAQAALPSVNYHGMNDAIYLGNVHARSPIGFTGVPTPVSGFNQTV